MDLVINFNFSIIFKKYSFIIFKQGYPLSKCQGERFESGKCKFRLWLTNIKTVFNNRASRRDFPFLSCSIRVLSFITLNIASAKSQHSVLYEHYWVADITLYDRKRTANIFTSLSRIRKFPDSLKQWFYQGYCCI